MKVDKTFPRINLKVFNHITWLSHPRVWIMQNEHKKDVQWLMSAPVGMDTYWLFSSYFLFSRWLVQNENKA